jgi:hypothetical protein
VIQKAPVLFASIDWLTGVLLSVASAVTFWLLLRLMGRSAGSEEPLDA